jgi:hypothetical protein
VTNPIRYAILDDASDEANLWELPWNAINENGVEIHPRRTVEEVRPWLIDLVRDGHVVIFRMDEPDAPNLELDEALAVIADEDNWDPARAQTVYGVITTESGDREHELERNAAKR